MSLRFNVFQLQAESWSRLWIRLWLVILPWSLTGCDTSQVSQQVPPQVVIQVESGAPGSNTSELPGSALGYPVCHDHLELGAPSLASQILCRTGYAAGYNYRTKEADWVAYRITAESVKQHNARSDRFREDEQVPEGYRSTLADYKSASAIYDRGHLAPAATVDFTYEAMEESFLLSNMTPQLAGLNRYGWASLEKHVRDCASEVGELYVVTGPVFESNHPATIGDGLAIPDAYYTVLLRPGFTPKAEAYLVPHKALSQREMKQYLVSVDSVELKTGLDFFSAIPAEAAAPVESDVTSVCAF